MNQTETHCVSIDGACLSCEIGASENGGGLLQRGNGDEVDQRPDVQKILLSPKRSRGAKAIVRLTIDPTRSAPIGAALFPLIPLSRPESILQHSTT
ncbi:hypothetical protein TNIN_51781 [Trichonephila inaurata madagascariensis]|uniref:Uncharacterized protein n=1 Tax=Trichonephila inaurata madagascariensis TaxID=2747483 RepID=A0A8X6WYY9_9ARAC|nr:hypothetical protein TNIN_51781 [Trichonephila inaurata madagascariensis]